MTKKDKGITRLSDLVESGKVSEEMITAIAAFLEVSQESLRGREIQVQTDNRKLVEDELGQLTDGDWIMMCVEWKAFTDNPTAYLGTPVALYVKTWLGDINKES